MTRRTALLAVVQIMPHISDVPQIPDIEPPDPWTIYAEAHNAFATKFNKGVIDVKLWKRVTSAMQSINHCTCKSK